MKNIPVLIDNITINIIYNIFILFRKFIASDFGHVWLNTMLLYHELKNIRSSAIIITIKPNTKPIVDIIIINTNRRR